MEFILLGILVIIGYGAAIIMRKTKTNNTTINLDAKSLDIEKIARQMGKIIAEEIANKLGDLNISSGTSSSSRSRGGYLQDTSEPEIKMDESIIPMAIKSNVDMEESNLDNMAQEETKTDTRLSGSKSKLANLFKNKKK